MTASEFRQKKRLVILDKDNCELDTLEVFGLLESVLEQISRDRGLDIKTLHNLTREANGEHRFNDVLGLIDYLNLEEIFKTGEARHALSDARAKQEWLVRSHELSVFYPGVLQTLKDWHEAGTSVVTQTDCERLSLTRRVWLTGVNAVKSGELTSPFELLSLYDRIYCKPSIGEPLQTEGREFKTYLEKFCRDYAVPYSFAAEYNRHVTAFHDDRWKPSLEHLDQILSDMAVAPEHAVYIGDSHKDGREARLRNIDFAWAEYGADWRPEVAEFYPKVASSSWSYGRDTVLDWFERDKIPVHAALGSSLADIHGHFEFESNPLNLRRSLEQSRRLPVTYEASPAQFSLT